MSVAFTKENDSEAVAANLPDRPISPHLNLVTASGLAALDVALAEAKAAYAAAQASGGIDGDRTAMARATRDLRYFSARRASAQLVEPGTDDGTARFGSIVTVEEEDGRTRSYRITGEDEADPATGSVSYVSPFARAVTGRSVGDAVRFAGRSAEIVAID
jgi:transcription elongation GreA/GreB family factor